MREFGPPAIILVEPQLGENIGAAARAMMNFELVDLRLVAPRDGWPNPSAGPAASGADVVLEQAKVFDTVVQAVADCPFVYATTVRKRGLVIPVVTPEKAAREMRTQAGASAVLFGAERSGLETEEAAIAQKILTVPINPEFRSLNLAQAVIIAAYEWSKHEALSVPSPGIEEIAVGMSLALSCTSAGRAKESAPPRITSARNFAGILPLSGPERAVATRSPAARESVARDE